MILAGLLVATRPLVGNGAPLTGSRFLDIGFAAFFLLRGLMNVRAARRPPRVAPPADSSPTQPGSPE